MRIDKGNLTMNIIFGTFLLVSITRISIDIYNRYQKGKQKKPCACSKVN